MKNKTSYLPLGSVVTLIDGTKPLMIYGRKQMQASSEIIWDYVACLYPEGNLGEDYNIFFQQEEIGAILFKGYVGKDEAKMLEILQNAKVETKETTKGNSKKGGKDEKNTKKD